MFKNFIVHKPKNILYPSSEQFQGFVKQRKCLAKHNFLIDNYDLLFKTQHTAFCSHGNATSLFL